MSNWVGGSHLEEWVMLAVKVCENSVLVLQTTKVSPLRRGVVVGEKLAVLQVLPLQRRLGAH